MPLAYASGYTGLRAFLKELVGTETGTKVSPALVDRMLADLDSIAQAALADVCAPGNPRPATREDLKSILKELM